MMENLREVMQEETRDFLNELARHADYHRKMTIASGELSHHIKDFCRSHRVDLVICGNHNHSCFRAPPARRKVSSAAAALMFCWFPLKGLTPVSLFLN
jgi:nucleotide-binding universal stress UspA family protein